MRRKFNPATLAGSLASWLPLLIIGVVIVVFVLFFKSGALGSLGNAFKGLADWFSSHVTGMSDWLQYGGTAQKKSLEEQVGQINKGAEKNKIEPSAINISISSQIHDEINSYKFFALTRELQKDYQVKALQLYENNSLRDQAGIIVAYGERSVPARLRIWSVLFEDTSGTLRDHVERYFTDKEQREFLRYIDLAIKTYLS